MRRQKLDPGSSEALRLEQEELERFEAALRWWIEDQANAPAFRDLFEVVRFGPDTDDLAWLAEAWRDLLST